MNNISIELKATAKSLVANYKGLLAMDESVSTCNKRFESAGIPPTAEFRRLYREMIVTTPNIGDLLNGAILFDETVYQSTKEGILFVDILRKAGVLPGIKVDEGLVDFDLSAKEQITTGLDGLPERLKSYASAGMRFAKWRAVFTIAETIPSKAAIEANTRNLAIYAKHCQEAAIVPIVEPEVLITGNHTINKCHSVTNTVLYELFKQLDQYGVDFEGIILKPNMVTAGDLAVKAAPAEVAQHTMACLLVNVPANVSGIAFLSGGQPPTSAIANLNAMNFENAFSVPWPVTFSFSRAIQQPALDFWAGKTENIAGAQKLLYDQLGKCVQARKGEFREN